MTSVKIEKQFSIFNYHNKFYGDTIYLKYAHMSGTPTKYMMRSFDGGWNWHPADSPLTDVERDLLQGDSVRVCLRQLDKEVGVAANRKAAYLDPERFTAEEYDNMTGADVDLRTEYEEEWRYKYMYSFYEKVPSALWPDIINYYDSITSPPHFPPVIITGSWAALGAKKQVTDGFRGVLADLQYNPTPPSSLASLVSDLGFDDATADDEIDTLAHRNRMILGKRLSDMFLPPAWCRNEPYCFYVSKGAVPIIERTVFIPRVEGVTVLSPELGQNSVRSQKDFTFRLKYAGKPMKVIAKRMIDGRVIGEVTGTPNADGEYEYVIRRVMQDITLEFTSADANTLVDQPSVWAYGGTLRIRSPKETTVRIYSASGLLVKQVAVHGDTTVPLAAGLYMVVLSDGTTHKVIVQ